MNELIERLARKAGLTFVAYRAGEWLNVHTATDLNVEAFAKLVARECAEIARTNDYPFATVQAIRERFGLD